MVVLCSFCPLNGFSLSMAGVVALGASPSRYFWVCTEDTELFSFKRPSDDSTCFSRGIESLKQFGWNLLFE